MPAKLAAADQMTIEEFPAVCDSRPDGGKWELIEGVAVMRPSPTEWHQRIVTNITTALDAAKPQSSASRTALLGIGSEVPVSPNSLPQPDAFVMQGAMRGAHVTDDVLVHFEVLSRSNTKAEQAWRKRVYASAANCQHYVTVSTSVVEVVHCDRDNGWRSLAVAGLGAILELAAIDPTTPLGTMYRWIPIGA
jgi:Uma2 family endonuclease